MGNNFAVLRFSPKYAIIISTGIVAQLVRALPCHGRGREFESRRFRHYIKISPKGNENIIRRFNRKVLQSGMMPLKKSQMRFSKPISKRERRLKAIIREARKAEKTERIKLGLK